MLCLHRRTDGAPPKGGRHVRHKMKDGGQVRPKMEHGGQVRPKMEHGGQVSCGGRNVTVLPTEMCCSPAMNFRLDQVRRPFYPDVVHRGATGEGAHHGSSSNIRSLVRIAASYPSAMPGKENRILPCLSTRRISPMTPLPPKKSAMDESGKITV